MTTNSQPPVFSERYELVRHIARGGMAQVYLAKDLLLDRQVALKVLFPELSVDPAFVRRFRREAQAAASLSHRNIVSIYDWGQGESTYCIVMEYVDGRTLSALARQQPLEPRRAAAVGADVAAALDFAHGRGVIHRDVKPGNVLIDRNGEVKVADFGIARAIGTKEGLTQTGAVMGTATYFSPEQAQGFSVDARSDVYSLGVVLYEIVAGQAPFTGDNPVSIAYKHVREQAVPLQQLAPSVPEAYAAIVAKAMAKDADDRYQSAGELEADLRRFVNGEPVLAEAVAATALAAVPDNTILQPATRSSSLPHTVVDAGELPPGPRGPLPGPEPDGERSRTGLYAALLVALLIVLAAIVFFLGRSLGWWDSPATLTVPTAVQGQTVSGAEQTLHRDGFSHVTTVDRTSTSVAANHVITTQPAPGSRLEADRTVTLVVSSGPKQVVVPDVGGTSQQSASTQLMDSGFKVDAKPQASSSVPYDEVIRSSPASGKEAPQGSTVTIYISTGPQKVSIPQTAGESVAGAADKLGALGLDVVANPVSEASSTVASGLVVGTDPAAGVSVDPDTTVTIYVSTGPAQVTVPDLSGLTQSAAGSELAAKGLKANFVDQPTSDQGEDGLVIDQSPGSAQSVDPGTVVTVTIGAYTAPTTTTTVPTSPTTTATTTTSTTTP